MALSGARASASTWTPKPVASGSGGRAWELDGSGFKSNIRPATSAECGMRSVECKGGCRTASDPSLKLRTPHSALRTCSASRGVDGRHQPDLRDVQPGRLSDGIQYRCGDVLGSQHGLPLREAGLRVGV